MTAKPLVALMLLLSAAPASAQSYYTMRLDDAKAVHADAMGARGDGAADDTAAIQAAIDCVQESTGHGIVFLPEGRYRITRTIHVWPSIRLIGYGARRPVLVLAAQTPGFTDPAAENHLVFFAGSRPGTAAGGRGAAAGTPSARRDPGHVLLGHEQHRHRDWAGQRGRGRRARHLRAALVPGPHGVPDRARDRRRP